MASPTVPKTEMPAALSPKVNRTNAKMDFFDALKAIQDSKSVARLEWEDGYYCLMQDSRLHLHKPETGKIHPWIIHELDMTGTDWVII